MGPTCDAGYQMVGASKTTPGTCEKCVPGKFKTPEAGDYEKCQNCKAGQFGVVAGAKSEIAACESCPRGHFSTGGTAKCTACEKGKYGDAGYSQETKEHCQDCVATQWADWSGCTKSCNGGRRVRSRMLVPPSSGNTDAEEQCPTQETEDCNKQPCPGRHHCHHLQCRFRKHEQSQKFAIQVYHNGLEPHNVHHCKLYTAKDGTVKCHCYCWYLNPQGSLIDL